MVDDSIWKGAGIGAALTAVAFALSYWIDSVQSGPGVLDAAAFIGLFFIGGVQVVWMIPAALVFRKKEQAKTATGILIIAGIVFLLNAVPLVLIRTHVVRLPGP